MCLNPHKLPEIGYVACRECWQCRERKVDDWVGRNIAESKTAKAAHAVSLTYGRDKSTGGVDHLNAAVLTYSDVQKMLKNLRVAGYPVRYFVAGEYGSLKGRAHWHILLYWQKAVPKVRLRENYFTWDFWPHGYSYWDEMSPQAVRYACKYLLKDAEDDAAQAWGPMPSKKPPLGDAYFRQLAAKHVQAGLAPQDFFYSFPDVTRVPAAAKAKSAKQFREAAKPVKFRLSDKSAENFLRYYLEEWDRQHGGDCPKSPIVWDYYDKGLDVTREQRTEWARERPFELERYFTGYVPVPSVKPAGWSDPVYDEKLNCYVTRSDDGQKLLYGTSSEGQIQWHRKGDPTALPLVAVKKASVRRAQTYWDVTRDVRF